ncbi:MAG TPA: hypothetical protein DGF10_03960 [Acidimicrobiaceae bacterium]|nr:hypothetical protein [Acidimicrobiaceae bacterium]HAQ22850.1 hypothetical protein [Acidimicrobiaceae bacterium]HCV33799.1 hypothetical protein [Acidimicrobiaceae bacterium]
MTARLPTMGEYLDQSSTEDPPNGYEEHRAARHRLASQVRGLVRDLNRLASDTSALNAASDLVAEAGRLLESPDRLRWYEVPLEEITEQVEDRLRAEAHDHSLYRGTGNPLAPPLVVTIGDDVDGVPTVVGTVQLDRNWEGPPGRVHGGYLAGLMDDVLSSAPSLVNAGPVVTARLSIRYREATPLDAALRIEAVVVRHSGRRVVARARCLVNDKAGGDSRVTVEAEALFVSITPRTTETQ